MNIIAMLLRSKKEFLTVNCGANRRSNFSVISTANGLLRKAAAVNYFHKSTTLKAWTTAIKN